MPGFATPSSVAVSPKPSPPHKNRMPRARASQSELQRCSSLRQDAEQPKPQTPASAVRFGQHSVVFACSAPSRPAEVSSQFSSPPPQVLSVVNRAPNHCFGVALVTGHGATGRKPCMRCVAVIKFGCLLDDIIFHVMLNLWPFSFTKTNPEIQEKYASS